MKKINPVRLGVVFALFLAAFHAAWVVLVAIGWAQAIMNFVFWAHFISPPFHIEAFEIARAAVLVSFVFAAGMTIGIIGGFLWNRMARAN